MSSAIELREIRVFLTLAEELHFGRAAEQLRITPSRVSQVIRTLESRVGGRLFERTSRQVTLTPLGQELRRRMVTVYEQMQQAYLDVREMATGVAGTLKLGVPNLAAGYPHLPEIIKVFEVRHPGCRVQVIETRLGRDQFDRLRRDELDVLAMCLSISEAEVVIGPVVSCEERVLAVAANHPLVSCGSVLVEDLADYTTTDIPTFSREVVDAFGPPRTPSGRPIRRAAMHSIAEAMVRVAAGEVVHPTVPAIIDRYRHLGITALPIRDLAPAETALMWLQTRDGLKIQAFAEAAADVLRRSGHAAEPQMDVVAARNRNGPAMAT